MQFLAFNPPFLSTSCDNFNIIYFICNSILNFVNYKNLNLIFYLRINIYLSILCKQYCNFIKNNIFLYHRECDTYDLSINR